MIHTAEPILIAFDADDSQFFRFEMAVRDPRAVKMAQQRWPELVGERDQWTQDLCDGLTGKSTPRGCY
jgi:hypothetical protein